AELASLERDLLAEITALWQTDDVRNERPSVRDEIRMGLDYYDASLFGTIPVLYREIAAALDAEFPPSTSLSEDDPASHTRLTALPTMIRFGSWIGGDRDGNPFVVASTTSDSLAMARNLLRSYYLEQLHIVFEQLASSPHQLPHAFARREWRLLAEHPQRSRPLRHRLLHASSRRQPAQRHVPQPAAGAGRIAPRLHQRRGVRRRPPTPARLARLQPRRASRRDVHRPAHPLRPHLRPASPHARPPPARPRARRCRRRAQRMAAFARRRPAAASL